MCARRARSAIPDVREEAIAAGIRRIEAVAGDEVLTWAKHEAARQQEKFEMLRARNLASHHCHLIPMSLRSKRAPRI